MKNFEKYMKIIQESNKIDIKKVEAKLADIKDKAKRLGIPPQNFLQRIINDLPEMGWTDEEIEKLEEICETNE